MEIFSKEDSKGLKQAINYFRSREGSFSGEEPLLKIIEKIDSGYLGSSNFTEGDVELLLKVINENIDFMNKYEGYKSLPQKQAINLKQHILEPLYQLKKELLIQKKQLTIVIK